MATIKCIKIDSKNKSVRYENFEMDVEANSLNPINYKDCVGVQGCSRGKAESIMLYFNDGTIEDPKLIPRYGFEFLTEALHLRRKRVDTGDYKGPRQVIIGDAVIVTFKEEMKNGRPVGFATPIDTTLSLEEVSRIIGKFNNGVEEHLPDFTCLIQERFSNPGYEMLLRLENEEDLGYYFGQPIRNLTPQILTFEYGGQELTVITGKIKGMNDKVQTSIFETGRADLRCIASCTLAANKIPNWVKGRLKDYYFELFFAKPLTERVGFESMMEEMHRDLGID